jgi:hypothetical protein
VKLMYREALSHQLRQVEHDVVGGERRLAELEARLFELKRSDDDTTAAEAELDNLRSEQRRLEQDPQPLLSRLQP